MKVIPVILGSVGLSLVLAAPSFAQTNTTNTAPAPVANAPVNNANVNNAPDGSLEMYHGMWRASKLVGSNVYNQDGKTVGSIDDLLVGKDGKIDTAVLNVGSGFLGIGGKLVAIPFNEFKFEESRRSMENTNVATNAAMAPGTTTATGAAPAVNNPNNRLAPNLAANDVNRNGPIYYSIVLPSATKQSLTSAATFKYNG